MMKKMIILQRQTDRQTDREKERERDSDRQTDRAVNRRHVKKVPTGHSKPPKEE